MLKSRVLYRAAPTSPPEYKDAHLFTAALLGIMVIAVLLRFAALGDAPPGVYQDEAYNGLDALAVLESGYRPLYFPANNGREPLYIYLAALSVGALGPTALALRLPAALLGALTVPAAFALGRAWFDRRTGLLAAAVLAVMFWHVHLSHIGLRAVALPLFTAMALAAGAHGLRTGRRWALALAGVAYGLSFYTYLAARFTPFALLLIGLCAFGWHRRALFAHRRDIALMALAAAITLAPLAVVTAQDPDLVLGRSAQVAIWNPAINGGDLPGALARGALASLGMFVFRSDAIPRHNLPGRPVFDPALALAWLAGVIVLLRASRRSLAAAAIVIWIGALLLPTALAEDAPHFLRAVGVLPAAALPAAVALARAPRVVAAAALAVGLGFTAYDYFGRYLPAQETALAFDQAATVLAGEINSHSSPRALSSRGVANMIAPRAIVDWRIWDRYPSVKFLTARRAAQIDVYDDRAGARPLPVAGDAPVFLAAFPYEPQERLTQFLPTPALIDVHLGPEAIYAPDADPFRLYVAYHAAPLPAGWQGEAADVTFEDGLSLAKVEIETISDTLRVTLYWRAQQPPTAAYTALIHLGDRAMDAPPGTWAFPTDRWRAGDVVAQRVIGRCADALEVGLYDAAGRRLPVVESRWPVQDNAARIAVEG